MNATERKPRKRMEGYKYHLGMTETRGKKNKFGKMKGGRQKRKKWRAHVAEQLNSPQLEILWDPDRKCPTV